MEHRAYRAIFFDLDGTLLPMDIDEFMQTYFKTLGAYVARFGIAGDDFMAGMKSGIKAMAAHSDGRPNAETFWEGFFSHVDRAAADWDVELARFYDRDFGEIGAGVVPNPAAKCAVATLAEKGYPLVLATMPMFPRRAVEWRLTWAGIDPSVFARLTTFEVSTSVKPKASYYAEVLAAAGVRGSDVLMVGNNTVEDLAAQALGVDAYLVTDLLLDPTDGFDLSTVRHGTMDDFAAWAAALPVCENPAEDVQQGLVSAAARDAVLATDGGAYAEDERAAGAHAAAAAAEAGGFSINGIED